MPLHHGAEAAHGRGAQVQLRRGQFPGKAADIEPPEQNPRQPGAQARRKLCFQLGPQAQLVACPVQGTRLRAGEVRAAESHARNAVCTQEVMICAHIARRIAVMSAQSVRAVVKPRVLRKEKLPAVGLEALHAHIQQVFALVKPPAHGVGIGEVHQQAVMKPVFRNAVRRSVHIFHAVPLCDGLAFIRLKGLAGRAVPFIFDDGDLPQHQVQPALPDTAHGCGGVLPASVPVPAVEGLLVAPRLQHHHVGGIVVRFQGRQLRVHLAVAVPAVGADPQAEGPFRRQRRFAGQLDEAPEQPRGRAEKQPVATERFALRLPGDGQAAGKVQFRGDIALAIPAQAGFRHEEGHGQIRLVPLPGKLFHHPAVAAPFALVHAVKAFARSPDIPGRKPSFQPQERDAALRRFAQRIAVDGESKLT